MVVANQSIRSSSMTLGVVWTNEVWKANRTDPMPKAKPKPHFHNGKRYIGWLRPTSEGQPDGTFKPKDKDNTVLSKQSQLADSETSFVKGSVEKVYQKAQQQRRQTLKTDRDDDNEVVSMAVQQTPGTFP